MRLTAIVDDREVFADELDMLAGKYAPDKMAEFTKQVQNKDVPNLMKLQILGREFELRAQEKELFIEKLKEGGLGSAVVAMPEPSFFVGYSSEGRRGIVEMIVSAMVSNTSGGGVHEVGKDLARVREYRGVVFGLNIAMQRREECIGELKALGDYEGSLKLRSLITELRYKADSSDWNDVLTYFCREAAYEDRKIATKLNRLREEMLIICEKRRNLMDELRSIKGIVVVEKAVEFVTDTVRKDNAQVAQLHGVESQMEFRALEKELHAMVLICLDRVCVVLRFCGSASLKEIWLMLRELAGAAGSTDIRYPLSVLFRREANEESQQMHDYRSSDEVIESIEILKGMQVNDMEKASRLILMAREIQNRVYEKYNFITKLRR
ncbi:hypothetical protein Tco_0215998 [Tanacetum coccineum]